MSISAPASAEEAYQAVREQFRRQVLDSGSDYYMIRTFQRPYEEDAGLGVRRTKEQVRWLEDARKRLEREFRDWIG